MARKPVVTRTIATTKATILCVNPDTRALSEVEKILPRTYSDNNAVMKYIEKNDVFAGTDLKPVSVVSTVVEKKLYKVDEDEFIKIATVCSAEEAQELANNDDTAVVNEQ